MIKELSLQRQSELIGAIYDCVLDPDRWREALWEMSQALNFHNISFQLFEMPAARFLLNVTANIPQNWQESIAEYAGDALVLWGGTQAIMSFDMSEPQVISRVAAREQIESSRYFREWGQPQGLIDLMAIGAARDMTMLATAGFGRHESQGPVTDGDIANARLFVPHIQRAVAISRIFDVKAVALARFEGALDALSAGVFIVDERLHILHANAAARELSGLMQPPRQAGSVLKLRSVAAAKALEQAVALAADNEAGIGRRGFGVPLGPNDGGPAVLHVLPLKHGPLRGGLVPGSVAAVFVAQPTTPFPKPTEAMASIYDLTPAEARVLALVADGETPAQASEKLGIGLGTVKSHLHQIFAKTGTSRQAELVSLAASLAAPV